MAAESAISADLKAKIGLQGTSISRQVEKGEIRRFAEALGDSNPLWNDEVIARKSPFGGLIASPTFLCSIEEAAEMSLLPELELPYERRLNGGNEWECFLPIRAGDRITAVTRVADIYERKGSLGSMLFTVLETTFTNQFGETVAVGRNTGIFY